MPKKKTRKPRRKPKRKPLVKGALWAAEIAEAAAKAKHELEEFKRRLGLQLEGELRKRERDRIDERRQQAKVKMATWSRDLSWQSKPPPPEVIYMIVDGKPVRYRLTHMHNMPVYLPDDAE